jgi:hypothetical protein
VPFCCGSQRTWDDRGDEPPGAIVRRTVVSTYSMAMVGVAALALMATSCGAAPTGAARAASPAGEGAGSLTGYTVVGPPSRPGARGPVTVALHSDSASRLLSVVRQLPSGDGPRCHEPASLMYRISLPAHGDQPKYVVGYRCGAAVRIVTPTNSSWRTDSSCQLIAEVRRDLPAAARGTQRTSVGCQ